MKSTDSDKKHHPSVADTVYEMVLSRINSGLYAENAKLPTEADFAKELNTSRPVVRSAIARLRNDGLVASRRGSGSFVLKRPGHNFLQFAPVESISDIQHCFEYRIMLEGEAAYLAAVHTQQEHFDKMEQALEDMDKAIETRDLVVEADFDFHRAIAEASANPFILASYLSLSEASHFAMNLARNLSLQSRKARLQTVQVEHHAIFQAIKDGQSEQAMQLMKEHIRGARRRVFEGPDKSPHST